MMFKILTDAVDEKLSLIAPVLREIEQGGQGTDLRDLGSHLVRALRLFERNPGIEAAADDLYAAAVALVGENMSFSQTQRKRAPPSQGGPFALLQPARSGGGPHQALRVLGGSRLPGPQSGLTR